MKLIKDLSSYEREVKEIYTAAFNEENHEVENILAMVDLKQAYGYIEENSNTLVSMVCPVERTLYTLDNENYKVVNLTCLATSKKFIGNKYGIQLMKDVADKLVNEYDSVIWQTNHWDIYKDFDLVECTNKIECEYILGEYPTPMLMIWDKPNVDLMMEIEMEPSENYLGIKQTRHQVEAMIELYEASGLKYIANPSAYIWYDPQTKEIAHLQYSSLAHLTWLMHWLKPKNSFNLFKEKDLKEFNCLKISNKETQITKTYKPSKKHFKNIKLNDFLI